MEEEVIVTPHRILSTCHMWDCGRNANAALYCSLYHADRSLAEQGRHSAAVYVDPLQAAQERYLTGKILRSMSMGHPCGIPTLPATVLQENPWHLPNRFAMNRLENEDTRHFVFFSDSGINPANTWQRYDIRNVDGFIRYSYTFQPPPQCGRYRLRRYTSPDYAGGSLFWMKFEWNKLKKRLPVTISVPETQQEPKDDPGPDHGTYPDGKISGRRCKLPVKRNKVADAVETCNSSRREYMGIIPVGTDANLPYMLTKSLTREESKQRTSLLILSKGTYLDALLRYAVYTGLGWEVGNKGNIISTDSIGLSASMATGAIRRLQDRVLRPSRTGIPSRTDEIWLLGVCYKISDSESTEEAAFRQDFTSLILMTYRRGFEPIGDTTYTSDVNWGCMLRSGQMLFAQALLFQRLGRSWRRKESEPPEEKYLEILELLSDSEASAFSIHNLILAGESYGLAAGSWVGPYAVCRSWESLVRKRREETDVKDHSCSMAVHIVSGSEDGERGGAPVLCIEDVTKTCLEYSKGETEWTSILLLVPLVLGLDKVNPRYIPSLIATFTFPQSLGILGGKPGLSTYIVGVQGDKGFYLDPHDVQQVVTVNRETEDVDTSSYHCNTLRYVPLESLDPSLALGFYCRDKDDFDDFCSRATKLARDSNGAPLFTVTQCHRSGDCGIAETSTVTSTETSDEEHEDHWQLL